MENNISKPNFDIQKLKKRYKTHIEWFNYIGVNKFLKKLLIISPHFPPINAADMHRVRQSVWYFEDFGWKPTVVCVDEKGVEGVEEPLLLESLPNGLEIIKVKAFSSKWTRKVGLGALALRSLFFYFNKVNAVLKKDSFNLIYFSTTQFPVLLLGRYWKWRFQIPYVIDMQDPWHSTYYLDKPKLERPSKYWFSYNLNKWLEPIAMKGCDGLISVSEAYIIQLQSRYSQLINKPSSVITFGAFTKDLEIAKQIKPASFFKEETHRNIVYVGRGGFDMQPALFLVFSAFKIGLAENPELYKQFRFIFIGTSYAPKGQGKKTIEPVAETIGICDYVTEYTDRVAYFEGLSMLLKADLLFIPGSDDPAYTASKLYPYILAKKPIMGIFHPASSAKSILEETNAGIVCALSASIQIVYRELDRTLKSINENTYSNETEWAIFEKYSAKEMTKKQVELFDMVAN